jgi:hypothetical protein
MKKQIVIFLMLVAISFAYADTASERTKFRNQSGTVSEPFRELIFPDANLDDNLDGTANVIFTGGSSGHTIQEEGSPLTARTNLNFKGTGVTAADDVGNDATTVTFSGGGYTNLTSFVDQTAWRIFYANGSGDVIELGLGANGEYLKSNGTTSIPSWATPSGAAHDAVTLDANADTILALSTQALGLDTQTANRVWAGPTTGAAAVPTFRTLVDDDIPDNITITEADPTVNTSAKIMTIVGNNGVLDARVEDALTISGGTINNSSVGATVASTGKFTTLTTSGNVGIGTTAPVFGLDVKLATISLPANSVTDAMVSDTLTASDLVAGSAVVADSEVVDTLTISGGTINNTAIGATVKAAGSFTDLTFTGTPTFPANSITDAMVSDTLTASDLVAGSAVVADSEVVDTLTISGGTINNSSVGATVASTGVFTTLTTSGNVGIGTTAPAFGLDVKLATISLPANSVTDAMVSDTLTASDLVAGSSVVADSEVDNNLTISAGTINNTTVGATVANTGAFTTLSSTQGTNLSTVSGNVGVGTTAPVYKLDVIGDLRASTGAILGSTSGNVGIGTTAPRQKLDVTTIGIFGSNVGIGTTAPAYNLDVAGTINLPANSITDAMVSNTLTASDLVAGTEVVSDAEVVDTLTISGGTINNSSVGATVASTGKFTTLTTSGNVGIGTTAPVFGLDVKLATISLPANSVTDAMVSDTLTASDLVAGSAVVADAEVVDALTISAGTINNTTIGATVANTGGFTTMTATSLTTTGNIGIGTTAPRQRLDNITIGVFGTNVGIGTLTPRNAGDIAGSLNVTGNVGIGTTAPTSGLQIMDSISIPNAASPTVDAVGEIALDTTDDQIVYFGAAKRVLRYEYEKAVVVENLAAADDNMSLGFFSEPVTITGVAVSYIGTGTTPATITLEDGSGNAMTITGTNPTAVAHGTNATFAAVTANNTLVAGEIIRFDVTNAVAPETDDYTIVLKYTVDAQ